MLRNIIIQIIFFVIVFNGLSWFKERSMLATNTQLPTEAQTLTSITGEKIELFSKNKKTVIYFFAPWCQVCHFSIENLEAFHLENPDYNVLAIALDFMQLDEVNNFVKQHKLTFPVVLGNEKIKRQFSIKGYPSYYVIDNKNKIIGKSLGYSSKIGMYLRTL